MNLMMPGNPRYQPQALQPYFGYDNLYRGLARVELAVLDVLGEIGVIPPETMARLTPELGRAALDINTTEVDGVERAETKHDVRAWVRIFCRRLPPDLARFVHVPLTSYDALDTGRILAFLGAHYEVVFPTYHRVKNLLAERIVEHAGTLQIGRTHGQHALPITVGFWLATILSRLIYNADMMDECADALVGKISGAVGAFNAQEGVNISARCGSQSFESRVLDKLNLKAARISTQILPPEPLGYYLFSCCMMSASLAQFGQDCRQLMRTEIAEISEGKAPGAVASSTMAHKAANPISLENLCGMWVKTRNEFGKVLDTLTSEHQRDLVSSAPARDFPAIVINVQTQLETLLREDKNGEPFISRLRVNADACRANFQREAHLIMAEPLYIALQIAGFPGDAHKLIGEELAPRARLSGLMLIEEAYSYAVQHSDDDLLQALNSIPEEVRELFHHPETYVGRAREKALEIAGLG